MKKIRESYGLNNFITKMVNPIISFSQNVYQIILRWFSIEEQGKKKLHDGIKD